MKKILGISTKVILILVVVSYLILIGIEYNRYQKDESMLIVLKEEEKEYDDGYVSIYWGLGYKKILYKRQSVNGKQFGPIFIRVREKI